MAASGQSRFGKFSVAAEWAAELSGEAQLILRGLETHATSPSLFPPPPTPVFAPRLPP